MKLKDFDFRIWDNEDATYEHPSNIIRIFQDKFSGKDISKYSIELFSGLIDNNGKKIYEGDIAAHYAEGGGIEYYSKVVFNQEKGAFEFVCIEHPIAATFDELENSDIRVVDNIHENKDLLNLKD